MKGLNLISLTLFSCLSFALFGQESQSFIVMDVAGLVNCVEYPGADQCDLVIGQTLGMEAVVSMTSGSTVRLLYGGQSISLKEAGNYPLKSLVTKRPEKSTTFFKRFFNYVYEGIVNTSGPKQIEKYHELYLTQSSGGIKGFAGADYGISVTQPVMGNIIPSPLQFEWFSAGDSILYDFQILDYQTDGLIFKALLRDTSAVVHLEQLAIEPGRKYYWMVQQKRLGETTIDFSLADDPYMRSPKVEFVVSGQEVSALTRTVETSEEYREAEGSDQLLMRAHALEEAGYPSMANEVLRNAMSIEPSNLLLRRVYAAFLIRQGLWDAAQLFL